jgi:hypothetical protein
MTPLFRGSLRLARIASILAVFCFSCFLSTHPVSARPMPGREAGKHRPLRRYDPTTVLNLRDYGAVGDGITDDSPALQQALDDLANVGGGVLQVPAGRYLLGTAVLKQFAPGTQVTIAGEPSSTPIDVAGNGAGLDLISEFIVAVGETNDAITLTGSDSLLIRDLAFIGVQEVATDARVVLALSDIRQTAIQHCEFYGLASLVPGGAIVAASLTDLKLEQTAFLGCAANSGLTTSIVQTHLWLGVAISDCKFIDYGNRPGFFSKTPLQSPYSWISIGKAAALEPTWSRREAIIKHVFLDEGSYFGIAARPDLDSTHPEPADAVSFPPYEIYLSRLHVNVNNLNSDGVYIYGARKVFIEQSHFGWSTHAGVAINLSGVGEAVLDLIDCADDATRIRVDAQRLAVINSVYASLDSTAPFTRTITTDTPEEDPAQYVRQQYLNALKHDPDPAGHFYWADQIVRCDANASCITEIQTALTVFLSAAPPARFSLSGQVFDEEGAPLAAVTVSLNGSQAVAMETDANGNFTFTNLATAGSYVLTPAKTHYTFESQLVVTPTTDQVTSFSGALIRHAIAGRVFANTGQALAGATLTLSGAQAQDDTTSSDPEGNFTFPDLAAGGDYVVSVARDNYVFDTASRAFTDLSADQYVVFEGAVPRYAISGQLTKADGSSLSGVSVSLAGTETGVVTTDSEGRYSFSVFAAGNFTVTPQEPHYTFSPLNFTVNNLGGNQLADFTGDLNTHTIAGRVFANTGSVLAGATVDLSGDQTATTTSDIGGNYTFSDLIAGGDYVVTASRANYTFSLSSRSFPDLISDQFAVFEGVLLNYTIGGRLAKADGVPLSGAVVTLSGGLGSTRTTGADGNYSFTVHGEDNYTVSASLPGYAFSPAIQTFTNVSDNQTANFTGTLAYVISGRVTTAGGAYLTGVTISVSGSHTAVVASDGYASYALILPADGDYTITPSRQNYTFSPSSIAVDDLGADQVRNFTAELSPGVPVVMAGPDPARAAAIDSVLRTGEPFKLQYDYPWVADRRTRLMLFATHFDLLPGEGATSLTATVDDGAHQIYPLTVEYAAKVEGFDSLICIVVRLSDDLTEAGDVLVRITYRGFTSEPMRIGIGHIGDGPAANVTSP